MKELSSNRDFIIKPGVTPRRRDRIYDRIDVSKSMLDKIIAGIIMLIICAVIIGILL